MKISELEKRIYAHTPLIDYIEEQHDLEHMGSNAARINPCPKCGGRDHFTIKGDQNYWTVFEACTDLMDGVNGGGLYKYLLYIEELTEAQASQKLYQLAGVDFQSNDAADEFDIIGDEAPTAEEQQAEPEQSTNTLIQKIPELFKKQTKSDREYFLKERGLTNQIVDEYQLFVHSVNGQKRAVLPIKEKGQVVSYIERQITGGKQYLNKKGAVRLFNIDRLSEKDDAPIIVTESVFDALTLEARGIKAISLNGVSNVEKFKLAVINSNAKDKMIFSAFDNDKAGRKATEKLGYVSINIPEEYKDVNEWSVAEIEAAKAGQPIPSMQDSLKAQLESGRQPDSMAFYLRDNFKKDINELRSYKDRKTGFNNLDAELQGVFPGLNVIGAVSGGGKTTFLLQLVDNMAKAGEHVLFFSLEQSKLEIASKSLARTTAELNLNDAVSSIQIRTGWDTRPVKAAFNEYAETAKRMNVMEGNFKTDARGIRETVERYIQLNKVTPVVVIDYLQIMSPIDESMSDKQKLDTNVRLLKQMSRDLNITVFAISSFNRGNYLTPVDFESFKESGGIEYTADMVWGLQLNVLNTDIFDKPNKMKEKRAAITHAMKQSPRDVELVCLKNRNGKARFNCTFDYWSKYDYFEETNGPKEFDAIQDDAGSPFDLSNDLLPETDEEQAQPEPVQAEANIFNSRALFIEEQDTENTFKELI